MSTPSPYEQAKAIYEGHFPGMSFAWYVEQHHKRGFVYSGPDYFVMALQVSLCDLRAGVHPIECDASDPDTWYITVMVGDIADAWRIPKRELQWFAYHRDTGDDLQKGLHVMPFRRVHNHLAA